MKHTQTLHAAALALVLLTTNWTSLTATIKASAPLKELVNEAHHAYKQNDLPTTLTIYKTILQSNPADPTLLYHYAHFLKEADDMQTATFIYQKVIELQPDNRAAQFGLSQCYLTMGNFEDSWKLFRYRSSDTLRFPNFDFNTIDLQNKKVLTRCEWGMGDMIQFVRYAKELKERGAIVYVQTYKALQPLFLTCPHIDKVVSVGELFPAHDIQIPLLSLPQACNTTIHTIPNQVPYLNPNEKLVQQWKTQFDSQKINIGVCWQGNGISTAPIHVQKNVSVELFSPLAALENVVLFSLQKRKIDDGGESFFLPSWLNCFEKDYDQTHGRFMDSAAIMKCLDLIITIDTSIAHLAGALGVPVWVLLPYKADWRWFQHIDWSPWYPTMRLFRQKKPGDWQNIIQEIITELEKISQTH